MPRINLLPWREQERRERKIKFFIALGAAAGAGVLVMGAAYVLVGSMIDAQDRRNARLQAEIKVLDKQIEEINDLDAQKQRFIARMQIIEKLQRSRPEVVHLFDELVKQMPDGTYLTSIKQSGVKIKLEGVAQSSTRVSTLMRNIASSQYLRNPELEVVDSAKENTGGSHFVLDAEQISIAGEDDSGGAPKRPLRTAGAAAGGSAK